MTLEECMAAGMSAPEASAATGSSKHAVRRWARRHGQQWHDARCVPVVMSGKAYPSIAEASRLSGVAFSTLKERLRRHGSLDLPKRGSLAPGNSKPVAGFPSISAAARALGVGRNTLRADLQGSGELIAALRMRQDAEASRSRIKDRDGRAPSPNARLPKGREMTEAGMRAREMAEQGASVREIMDATGVAPTTARTAIKRAKTRVEA